MAAKRTRKKTTRRKSKGRRKAKTHKSKGIHALTGPKRKKPRKKARTPAQKAATARMLAANRAKRGHGHHVTPRLPSIFRRETVRPRSHHPVSHSPEAQTIRLHPRREVGHEFYD